MSLLDINPQDKPGVIPTQMIIMAPDGYILSNLQINGIKHAYNMFCTARRVSIIDFSVRHFDLQDGTTLRIEGLQGNDRIFVWPLVSEDLGSLWTFYCVPFDEGRLTDDQEAIWGIERWKDSSKMTEKESLLNGLKEAKKRVLQPQPGKQSQPGNQTWFAKSATTEPVTRHKYLDYVLSWWGPDNRYNYEAKNDNSWGYSQRTDGKWYDEPTQPPELNRKPPADSASMPTNYLWLNGYKVDTGLTGILSACIGTREVLGRTVGVVRVITGTTTGVPQFVCETSFASLKSMAIKGAGTPTWDSYPIDTSAAEGSLGVQTVRLYRHPPYWNSSGNQAMCVVEVIYPNEGGGLNMRFGYGNYVLKLSFDGSTVTSSNAFNSTMSDVEVHQATPKDYNNTMNGGGWTETYTRTVRCAWPLGADFDGDDEAILKAEYSEDGAGNRDYSTGFHNVSDTVVPQGAVTNWTTVYATRLSPQPTSVSMGYSRTYCESTVDYSEHDGSGTWNAWVGNVYGSAPGSWAVSEGRTYVLTEDIIAKTVLSIGNTILLTRQRDFHDHYSGGWGVTANSTYSLTSSGSQHTYLVGVPGLFDRCDVFRVGGTTASSGSITLEHTVTVTGVATAPEIVAGDLRAKVVAIYECPLPMVSVERFGDVYGNGSSAPVNSEHTRLYRRGDIEGSYSFTINGTESVSCTATDYFRPDGRTGGTDPFTSGWLDSNGLSDYGFSWSATRSITPALSGNAHVADKAYAITIISAAGETPGAKAPPKHFRIWQGTTAGTTASVSGTSTSGTRSVRGVAWANAIAEYPAGGWSIPTLLGHSSTTWIDAPTQLISDLLGAVGVAYTVTDFKGTTSPSAPVNFTSMYGGGGPVNISYSYGHSWTGKKARLGWNPTLLSCTDDGTTVTPVYTLLYTLAQPKYEEVRPAAFSACASSPDRHTVYIGIQTKSCADPASTGMRDTVTTKHIDKWFVDGVEVVPTKAYTHAGALKNLAAPVFVGPYPPERKKQFP